MMQSFCKNSLAVPKLNISLSHDSAILFLGILRLIYILIELRDLKFGVRLMECPPKQKQRKKPLFLYPFPENKDYASAKLMHWCQLCFTSMFRLFVCLFLVG